MDLICVERVGQNRVVGRYLWLYLGSAWNNRRIFHAKHRKIAYIILNLVSGGLALPECK